MKNNSAPIMAGVFRKLLAIQIFAVITATLGSVVDGIIISSFLGRSAMAGFSVVMPVFVVLACISNMAGNGAQTICGKALGRGEGDRVNGVFTLTMASLTVLGAVITVLLFAFRRPLAMLLGASGDSLPLAEDYICGLAFGAVAIMLSGPVMCFLQLDRAAEFSFLGVLTMTAVNIAGDLLNVYVFGAGMFGMSAVTSVSYWVSLLLLASHFRKKEASIRLAFDQVRPSELKDIITVGLPTAVSQGCNAVRSFCLNRILMILAGTLFVAAYAVQNTVSQLVNSVGIGVGMTVLLVLSVLVGEEDRPSLVRTVKSTLSTAVLLNTLIAAAVFFGADALAGMFGKGDAEVQQLSASILRVYALSLPFSVANTVLQYYFQSMRRMKLVNMICVCHNLLFMVAFALILPHIFGRNSVWLLFPLTQIATLLMIFGISCRWNRGIPRSFEQFLMLDAGFGVPETDRLEFCVSSMEEVINISVGIEDFCLTHGVSRRRAMIAALAMEEMAGNIVRYGFDDGKPHRVEGCLTCLDDALRLRLKDDCRGFNPKKQLEILHPEDPCANIGIRLVARMARDMKYQNTFKLNILTVDI